MNKTIRAWLAIASIIAHTFVSIPFSAAESKPIILQSTTSTQNSGLLDYLLPKFTRQTGIKVQVVAVGTGQALKNGRNGDADVLLVHAKKAELDFVKHGFGLKRFDVMFNDFVIVGPADDPARLSGSRDVLQAFTKISQTNALFVSRGDNSGTHKMETALWQRAGVNVTVQSGKWYRETGSGMGSTLNTAAGMGAYTLADRATWIAFKNKASMKILYQGDKRLFNQYGVILINPEKYSHVNANAGEIFVRWLTGEPGQAAIGAYRMNGKQLFFPNAKSAK